MEQKTEQQIKAGVDLGRVRAALGPVLASHGVSLVDLEWGTDRTGWTLRVTIEREGATPPPELAADALGYFAGVSLGDCADVSRDISSVLDVEDLIPQQSYHLEVSSPGLDRPLRTAADFRRFMGQMAKVKLSRPAPDGQRVLRGTLAEAPEGTVAVIVDGKRVEAPLSDVSAANLVFELAPQPKKGKGGHVKGAAKADTGSKTLRRGGGPGKPARPKR